MKPRQHKTISFVVSETGGDASSWVQALRAQGHEVVLMRQTSGESLRGLASRLRTRCDVAKKLGEVIDTAVIVGGGQVGDAAVSARSLAIRALTGSMVPARRGRVLLAADGDARFTMQALATAVSTMVRGAGVEISAADVSLLSEPAPLAFEPAAAAPRAA